LQLNLGKGTRQVASLADAPVQLRETLAQGIARVLTAREAFDRDAHLSGTTDGPEGGKVPNITPDETTGIGRWSDAEIVRVLETGMLPDYDVVGSGMGDVVRNSTSLLTPADRAAIVAYLRTLPAIANPDARATQPEY